MAATERNEVILSEGNGLQNTKLLTDKINAVCRIEIVIEDSTSGKRQRIKGQGTGFLSKLYTPSERGCSEIYGVVTNNHVLPSETYAKNAIVTFVYDGSGEEAKVKLKPEIMFRTEKELDYTFVGVKKADIDGLKRAIEPILMEPEPELKLGENVMIIQHPKGEQKKFSLEKISKVEKLYVSYKADTESGSSGSPVLTYEGLALIAVHHTGNEKEGYNKGTLISQILKHLQEGSYPAKDPDQSAPKTDFSSVSGKRLKEGVVTDDDLQTLGKAIGVKWDRLARRLPGIKEEDIEEIEDSRKTLSERGFHMLKLWRTNNGKAADYKTLYNALVHELVQRRDLAEKYCFE